MKLVAERELEAFRAAFNPPQKKTMKQVTKFEHGRARGVLFEDGLTAKELGEAYYSLMEGAQPPKMIEGVPHYWYPVDLSQVEQWTAEGLLWPRTKLEVTQKPTRFVDESDFRWDPENEEWSLVEEEPFIWLTHSGQSIPVTEMATQHIFYALRMIFNHTVPTEFQTPLLSPTEKRAGKLKRYPDVPHWSAEYCAEATKALFNELQQRDPADLTPEMEIQLKWIRMAATTILAMEEEA